VSSVFSLTAQCSSLTVNLVVTLRKFVSLLLSVIYFNNDFTAFHWLGTFLVFTGTLLFTDVLSSLYSHHSAGAVISSTVSEEAADRDYLLVNGKQAVTPQPTTFTDAVMRKRITGHRFADKEYLDVDRCSYHDKSVPCDVGDKVIDPQLVAVTACEANDLLKKVNQCAIDGAVSETVLTHSVCLHAGEGCHNLSSTTYDGGVSNEPLNSL